MAQEQNLADPALEKAGAGSFKTAWVLTDGKIGDDVQCFAIARALADHVERRVVAPGPIFAALAPWGPVPPRDQPENPGSPIAPPFPDIVITSGRRAIAYARMVKRASRSQSKIVFMKNPRIKVGDDDIVWAPAHDRLKGANVISTLTSPHEMSARIEKARTQPDTPVAALPAPRLGVILGGPTGGQNGGVRFDDAVISDLSGGIVAAARDFAGVAVTASRRTPLELIHGIEAALADKPSFIWRGEGENPYADILALSDCLIVTADSHNMMSEAAASGIGIYAYRPPGLAPKLGWFTDELEKAGVAKPLDGRVSPFRVEPIDATPVIVGEIKARLMRVR